MSHESCGHDHHPSQGIQPPEFMQEMIDFFGSNEWLEGRPLLTDEWDELKEQRRDRAQFPEVFSYMQNPPLGDPEAGSS